MEKENLTSNVESFAESNKADTLKVDDDCGQEMQESKELNTDNDLKGVINIDEDDKSYDTEKCKQESQIMNVEKSTNLQDKAKENVKPIMPSKGELLNPSSSLSTLLVYSSDSSDNDSDSYECESDSTELNEVPIIEPVKNKKKDNNAMADTLKCMGELTIDDLPPVPDISMLNLNIKAEDCDEIGKISSIVEKLVMVESIPNKPAYDVDTLLFLDNGKQPLGYIFDVIGAVTCPMYAIRFNSTQEIASLNITQGLPVYSAPKSEHAQYVFVQQLLQQKGTDASWMDDNEVPTDQQDFSDDEAELCNKKLSANRKRNSIDRHQNFEKDMNVKNLIDSRLHKIRDNYEPSAKKQVQNNNHRRAYPMNPNFRPNFAFSQPNTSSTSCAFPPPFAMAPFMPSNLGMPPYNPPFVPNLAPANFSMPPPLPNLPAFQMQPNLYPDMMNVYQNIPVPSSAQPKAPVFPPPDMGLPRPPSQNPGFVSNLNYFDPRVHMWHNFNNPAPNVRQRFPPRTVRSYFPKRQ